MVFKQSVNPFGNADLAFLTQCRHTSPLTVIYLNGHEINILFSQVELVVPVNRFGTSVVSSGN